MATGSKQPAQASSQDQAKPFPDSPVRAPTKGAENAPNQSQRGGQTNQVQGDQGQGQRDGQQYIPKSQDQALEQVTVITKHLEYNTIYICGICGIPWCCHSDAVDCCEKKRQVKSTGDPKRSTSPIEIENKSISGADLPIHHPSENMSCLRSENNQTDWQNSNGLVNDTRRIRISPRTRRRGWR